MLSILTLKGVCKKMNVSLTPELETLVNEKVKSGNLQFSFGSHPPSPPAFERRG